MTAELKGRIGRLQLWFLVVGLGCLALSGYGAVDHRRQFFFSYLAGWLFWMGLSTGSLLIVMIHQLTGGRWGYPTRRFFEAALMVFPLLLILFIPICFGLHDLYPWARPQDVLAETVLRHRQGYQTLWAYAVRSGVTLLLLTALAWYLRRCSLWQDATTDATPTRRARALSGPGLVLTGLLMTFACVDWMMSLEPRWHSTVFAVVVMGGQVLLAFAFAVVMLTWFRHSAPFAGVVNKPQFHQLGNLLLTFVMFWAYVAFGQLLVIYSGDLPPELDWYLHRIAGSWKYVVGGLALFHFFAPFFLLLFRAVKLHVAPLACVAGLVFVAHAVDVYWLVMPSLHQHGVRFHWLDLTAPIGIGCVWLSCFFFLLKRAPLLPLHDPGLQFAFNYGGQGETAQAS